MRRRAAEKRAEYRAFFAFFGKEKKGHIFRTYRPADVFNINVY
jgi:hypothetical protein